MPGQIKIDDGSGNYTVLTNGGSLGSDKTITIPNETATLATTNASNLGGLVKLASATASNSSELLFDNFVDNSVYASYLLYIENHTPQNNATGLSMTFRNSSPADFTDSYLSAYYERRVGSGAGTDAEGKQTTTNYGDIWGGQTTTTANTLSATAILHMPDSGLARFHIDGSLKNSGNTYMWIKRDIITNTATGAKGIKLYENSGNITSGVYTIFGVKK
jgi:hypothetical protein